MTPFAFVLMLLMGLAASAALFSDPGPDEPDETDPPDGEHLVGTNGDDLLIGGLGDDLIEGLDGNDTLDARAGGTNTLIGGAGDDVLHGGRGDDLLIGGAGNDTLDGGAGINTLLGGEGDDVLILTDDFEDRSHFVGNDFILDMSHFDGGDGGEEEGDLFDATRVTEGLHLLHQGDGNIVAVTYEGDRGVTLSGFERFALGPGGNVFFFDDIDRDVFIESGAGYDQIMLGMGSHTVHGGAGDDEIWLEGFGPNSHVDGGDDGEVNGDLLVLSGVEPGMEMVIGTGGAGEATVGENRLTFTGIERFEVYAADVHIDAREASSDLDIRRVDGTVLGGSGNDHLVGNGLLDGGAGDDYLQGHGTLLGGEGNDTLNGSGILDGGEGDDLLQTYVGTSGTVVTGGEGMDTFQVSLTIREDDPRDWAPVQITDLEPGETIELNILYASPSFAPVADPVVTFEEDAEAGEVRVLVDGRTITVLEGIDTLPAGAVQVTITAYDNYADA